MPKNSLSSLRARRATDICFQCRNRKVRCDGQNGGCENCRRLRFECSLSKPDSPQEHVNLNGTCSNKKESSQVTLERRRTVTACFNCREKRTKCSGDLPFCQRCSNRHLQCQYPSSTVRSGLGSNNAIELNNPEISVAATSTQSIVAVSDLSEMCSPLGLPAYGMTSGLTIDKTLVEQHIAAFFEFVYPIPCFSFIHKTSFLHGWSHGKYNPRLLQSICGVSARYLASDDVQRQQTALRWINEAESLIYARTGDPTASDVESLLLISLDHAVSRRFKRAMITTALAARLTYMMRLNHENGKLEPLVQERHRRLVWSVFVFDKFFSSGRAEFTVCPKNTVYLQLPWPEHSFTMDSPTITEPLRMSTAKPPSNLGLMALCIRLLDIRDRITRFTQKIIHHRKPLSACFQKLKSFEEELEAFRLSLSTDCTFTSKNLFIRAYRAERTTFVMFHIWWHQCHCDLFRFSIPGFREGLPASEFRNLPSELIAYWRKRCLEHALGVSEVISIILNFKKDIFISDPSLAICSFHAARIIFRLGQPEFENLSTDFLIDSLTACSEILRMQTKIYPTTKLLQRGIQDLIHDAQKPAGGLSPRRSTWEHEQPTNEEQSPIAEVSMEISFNKSDICSRFSIAEEIRKMEFPVEEMSPTVDHDHNITHDPTGEQVLESDNEGGLLRPHPSQILQGSDQHTASFSFSAEPGCATPTRQFSDWPGAGSDMFVMLGLDIDDSLAQSDIFLDTFVQDKDFDWEQ